MSRNVSWGLKTTALLSVLYDSNPLTVARVYEFVCLVSSPFAIDLIDRIYLVAETRIKEREIFPRLKRLISCSVSRSKHLLFRDVSCVSRFNRFRNRYRNRKMHNNGRFDSDYDSDYDSDADSMV